MGAIQVAELLQLSSQNTRERSRTWQTMHGGKDTLCHVQPALSTDPGEKKISFIVRADLDSGLCREVGEHLVWLAEELEDFPLPAKPLERRVPGRSWEVGRIGEAKTLSGYNQRRINRRAFLQPFEKDGKQIARVRCSADLTPRVAREMGVYLLGLASQVD